MDAVLDWYHCTILINLTDNRPLRDFAAFRDDPHGYARAVAMDRERGGKTQRQHPPGCILAKQSAHVVSAAEEYHRTTGQSARLRGIRAQRICMKRWTPAGR